MSKTPRDPTFPLDSFEPADLEPLSCDQWVASSSMQKAIRRGDRETVERAILTLLRLSPRNVVRRLLIIAAEDIGVGDLPRLVLAVSLVTEKAARFEGESNQRLAVRVGRILAASAKDRSTDLLISAVKHHPSLEEIREVCRTSSLVRCLDFVADTSLNLEERCVAAWVVSGLDAPNWRPKGNVGLDDLLGVLATLVPLDGGFSAVSKLARRTREPIAVFLPLIRSVLNDSGSLQTGEIAPVTPMVNGVPLCALDGHTRLGRQAIRRFAQDNDATRAALKQHGLTHRAARALQLAVFYVDSAVTYPRFVWDRTTDLEMLGMEADFQGAGIDPAVGRVLIDLVRNNLDYLNAIRGHLLNRSRTI